MMATVPHVTSGSGLRKYQADGFLLDRVYVPCYSVPLFKKRIFPSIKNLILKNTCLFPTVSCGSHYGCRHITKITVQSLLIPLIRVFCTAERHDFMQLNCEN